MKSLILIALFKGARLKSKMISDEAWMSPLPHHVWHQGMGTWGCLHIWETSRTWTYPALDVDLIEPQTHVLSTFISVLPWNMSNLDMSYPSLFLLYPGAWIWACNASDTWGIIGHEEYMEYTWNSLAGWPWMSVFYWKQ